MPVGLVVRNFDCHRVHMSSELIISLTVIPLILLFQIFEIKGIIRCL